MDGFRKVLRSKIHRATVTQADLHYEGSITIPPELMHEAGLVAYEAVNVWNVTQGTRFETYAIEGLPESSDICVNGAAAHLVKPKDLVIIACFMFIKNKDIHDHKPMLVFVDANNKKTEQKTERPGPEAPLSWV